MILDAVGEDNLFCESLGIAVLSSEIRALFCMDTATSNVAKTLTIQTPDGLEGHLWAEHCIIVCIWQFYSIRVYGCLYDSSSVTDTVTMGRAFRD